MGDEQKAHSKRERVSCLLWTEIAFGGWRTRFSLLDLDVAASWRASQTEDEVAQCEAFAGRLRQANTAMNCARLCGEVRQGVREAKVRSQLFFIDDKTLRSTSAVVVNGDEFELIVADV